MSQKVESHKAGVEESADEISDDEIDKEKWDVRKPLLVHILHPDKQHQGSYRAW